MSIEVKQYFVGVMDWRSIAVSDNNEYKIACVYTSAELWTQKGTDTWILRKSGADFTYVAISSTGQYQTAVELGAIWVSSDYGQTWTTKGLSRNYQSIVISSTGQYQTAVVAAEYIYISSDYGETWTAKKTDAIRDWFRVAISSTGQYQTAVVQNGKLYISLDYGQTWTEKGVNTAWVGGGMSATGQYQTFGVFNGKLQISSDYGQNWVEKGTVQYFYSVAVSSTGQYQTAVARGNGKIWVSSDYGQTWTQTGIVANWYDIDMTADATTQVACVNGGLLYKTSDFWTTTNEIYFKTLTLIPKHNVQQTTDILIARTTTYSGRDEYYKHGIYERFNFELDFISNDDGEQINTWWQDQTTLTLSYDNTEYTVKIIMKNTPFSKRPTPYTDAWRGRIHCEEV